MGHQTGSGVPDSKGEVWECEVAQHPEVMLSASWPSLGFTSRTMARGCITLVDHVRNPN